MKKICYFINSDWYFDLHWLERAYAAQKHGYQVHVIARFDSDSFYKKFSKLGFTCHHTHLKERSTNPFGFIYSSIQIMLLLRRINPDILHSITIKPIVIGGLFCRWFNKSFVANIVGLGRVFDCSGRFYSTLRKIVCRLYQVVFRNPKSKLIFEHSQDLDTLSQYVNFLPSQTTVIDGAGVNINFFSYQQEIVSSQPTVFFASRMLKNKGLKTLIEIRQELAKQNLPFQLLVAGIEVPDDPEAIPSTVLAQWHQQGDMVWLGTRKDIEQLIASSHIVALPTSYPEGVPRILIEACAIGRACIAYDSGGCRSIIQDGVTGFLVAKDDKCAFRDKLITLLTQPSLREQMGLNGRALVAKRFSSDKIIDETLKIYQAVTVP